MGQVKQDQAKPKSAPAKTMMFGMTPPQAPSQPAAQAPPQAKPAPMVNVQPAGGQPAPAQSASKPADNKKTMLGVPAVTGAQPAQTPAPAQAAPMARMVQQPAPAQKPVADADALKAKRTVLGMPAVTADAVQELKDKAPQAASQPQQPQAAQPAQTDPAPQAAAPAPEQRSSVPAPTAPLEPVRRSDSPPPKEEPQPPRSYEDDGYGRDAADSWPDEEPPPRRGSSGLLMVALVAGAAIMIAAGLIVYLLFFRGGSDLQPQVLPSPDGENLTVVVTVPDAPAGSQIQVGGQAVPVVAGQARFDVAMAGLNLGENRIEVALVDPQGGARQLSFPIMLRHIVRTDLSGLVTADPFVVVSFQVAQGMSLFVEGKPVQMIGGVYAHRIPLSRIEAGSEGSGDALVYKVPFQLTSPDGTAEAGQHVVNIPATELRIDRPAPDAVVALDVITCSGVTEEGATVTVNGSPVGVTAAGFNTSVPLDAIGDHVIEVSARAPGKAPRVSKIKVTRIQSLDTAIEDWAEDLDRSLDYPNLARDPNLHTGKRVHFSGRVVNISTKKGVTAFLLYVGKGCPSGAKCAVYVAFRGETDAGLQSLVDVYGTVRGTWDVDLTGGRKETMPALDAAFVVRSEDGKKGRKRGR